MKTSMSMLFLLFIFSLAFAGDIPNECRIGGFYLGPQAYSFRLYTLFQAIDYAKEAGCSVIEAYPGQKLSPADSTPFSHNAPPAIWSKAKRKLHATGVRLVNYGVVGFKDDAELQQIFDFAKLMDIPCITMEPDPATAATLDKIEKLVKQYDIKVAIHNHPRSADHPDYQYWDPNFVLSLVKDRDPRIGSGADTGHWLRSGVKPVDALKILQGRVISCHLKDLNKVDRKATDVVFGQGVANVKAILDELKRQGFNGNISMEYESNWENNIVEIKECVAFVRNYGK
jgi:sugar phosphate isomerase/epimerase